MSERNIAITLGPDKRPCPYNTVSPIFYDGSGRPHVCVQAKKDGKKFALLLRLTDNDVWIEEARDMAIWGEVALVQRPNGTAYLDGQTRELQKHISADIAGWIPVPTMGMLHTLQTRVSEAQASTTRLAALVTALEARVAVLEGQP